MKTQLFISKNLAIHLFYDESNMHGHTLKVKHLYLVVPGLPQNTAKDFFHDKVKNGYAFFYLHYYGSWFSGGKFSFVNCQKSITDALLLIRSGSARAVYDNKIFGWSFSKLTIVANSFGASPLLAGDLDFRGIHKIVMLAPFILVEKNQIKNVFTKSQSANFYKKNKKFLGFMIRGYREIYRGIDKPSWLKYFEGNEPKSIIRKAVAMPLIELVHGLSDKTVSLETSRALSNLYGSKLKSSFIPHIDHDFEALFNWWQKKK